MKNRITVLAVLFGFLLAAFGCANPKLDHEPNTNLTKAEVIRLAKETAQTEGYDIGKYNMTACHYEFTRKDHTWTVFFELKPPTPPGGHFMVSVDDQTKKAILAHGM